MQDLLGIALSRSSSRKSAPAYIVPRPPVEGPKLRCTALAGAPKPHASTARGKGAALAFHQASWPNAVEGFFSTLTRRKIRRTGELNPLVGEDRDRVVGATCDCNENPARHSIRFDQMISRQFYLTCQSAMSSNVRSIGITANTRSVCVQIAYGYRCSCFAEA